MAPAAIGYGTGAQRRIADLYRRLRATRGFIPPGAEYEAMRGEMAARYPAHLARVETGERRELEEERFAHQKAIDIERLGMTREQMEAQERAAMISGGISLVGTAAMTEFATRPSAAEIATGAKPGGWEIGRAHV